MLKKIVAKKLGDIKLKLRLIIHLYFGVILGKLTVDAIIILIHNIEKT